MKDTFDIVKRFVDLTTTYGWPPMTTYHVADGGKTLSFGFRNAEKKCSASIQFHTAPRQPTNIVEALSGGNGEVDYHLHIVVESARMKLQFDLSYPTVEKMHENISADVQAIIANLSPIKTLPEMISVAIPTPAPAPSQVN